MKTIIQSIGIATAVLVTTAALAEGAPKGWLRAGSHPRDYLMSTDHDVIHGGKGSATVKCTAEKPGGFGTLMQTFRPGDFRGQRVRFSGYVRADNVADWAGLWMRVDGASSGKANLPETLAFDNMQRRAIKGTSDWTRYEIVLDVPMAAEAIAFGILLTGKGQVWIDDISVETVGKDVPTTATPPRETANATCVNLDFEE